MSDSTGPDLDLQAISLDAWLQIPAVCPLFWPQSSHLQNGSLVVVVSECPSSCCETSALMEKMSQFP